MTCQARARALRHATPSTRSCGTSPTAACPRRPAGSARRTSTSTCGMRSGRPRTRRTQARARPLTAGELMDAERARAWLDDAAAGKTRTRNTSRGPEASAYPNSMRVRIELGQRLRRVHRRDGPPGPAAARARLSPHPRRHRGAAARPDRQAAHPRQRDDRAAHRRRRRARRRHRPRRPRARRPQRQGAAPGRRRAARRRRTGNRSRSPRRPCTSSPAGSPPAPSIVADLEGSDPGHLWIPTKPGRARGGVPSAKPGISPAAVRTLHASHRALVSQLLGTPLRPGALRAAAEPHPLAAPEQARS